MKLLFLTNVFPNSGQPTKGVFNLELVRALAPGHEVRVIAPVAWVDEWQARQRGPGSTPGRPDTLGGVEVHYPRFYYPPKMLRRFYGWFLWQSVRGTLQRLL